MQRSGIRDDEAQAVMEGAWVYGAAVTPGAQGSAVTPDSATLHPRYVGLNYVFGC